MDIFKAEDFQRLMITEAQREPVSHLANRILKERLKVGYVFRPRHWERSLGPLWSAMTDKENGCGIVRDTHRIYYFTEPIEPEKPKCDCIQFYCNADGKGHIVNHISNFCPKCGEKITK